MSPLYLSTLRSPHVGDLSSYRQRNAGNDVGIHAIQPYKRGTATKTKYECMEIHFGTKCISDYVKTIDKDNS